MMHHKAEQTLSPLQCCPPSLHSHSTTRHITASEPHTTRGRRTNKHTRKQKNIDFFCPHHKTDTSFSSSETTMMHYSVTNTRKTLSMKQDAKTNHSSITDSLGRPLRSLITGHKVRKNTKINPLHPAINASPTFILHLPFVLHSSGSVVSQLTYSKALDLETSAEQQTAYVYLIIGRLVSK